MKERLKKWAKKFILPAICTGGVLYMYGRNQKLKGEISNLKDTNSGLRKTIERQSYIIGKQNQKLYGK